MVGGEGKYGRWGGQVTNTNSVMGPSRQPFGDSLWVEPSEDSTRLGLNTGKYEKFKTLFYYNCFVFFQAQLV